jgi:hypothetical protein
MRCGQLATAAGTLGQRRKKAFSSDPSVLIPTGQPLDSRHANAIKGKLDGNGNGPANGRLNMDGNALPEETILLDDVATGDS